MNQKPKKQPRKRKSNFKNYITIYSDGSAFELSGSCAIVVLDGNEQEIKDMDCQYYEICNSYQAELLGLEMAIDWFRKSSHYLDKRKRIRNLVVKTDCKPVKTVFERLQKAKQKGLTFDQACKGEYSDLTRSKEMWRKVYEKTDRVSIKWVKGHSGLPFNVLVDYLAGECRRKGELKYL